MRKRSLLIAVVLIFALVSTAIALENQNAGLNFKNQDCLNAISLNAPSQNVNYSVLSEDINEDDVPEIQVFVIQRKFANR